MWDPEDLRSSYRICLVATVLVLVLVVQQSYPPPAYSTVLVLVLVSALPKLVNPTSTSSATRTGLLWADTVFFIVRFRCLSQLRCVVHREIDRTNHSHFAIRITGVDDRTVGTAVLQVLVLVLALIVTCIAPRPRRAHGRGFRMSQIRLYVFIHVALLFTYILMLRHRTT